MGKPTSRQIDIFATVMREGSYTAAAHAMGMTQPGVSRAMGELEVTVGFTLFAASGRGIVPTADALRLMDVVRTVYVGLDRVASAAADIRNGAGGTLRLGALPALAETFVAQAAGAFAAAQGGRIAVELETYNQVDLLARLRDGTIDIGICEGPVVMDRIAWTPLFETTALLIGERRPQGVTKGGAVPLSALDRCAMCCLPPDSPFAVRINAALLAAGAMPRTAFVARTQTSLLEAVRAGLGQAIIDPMLLKDADAALGIAKTDPPISWQIGWAMATDTPADRIAKGFAQFIGGK